MARLLPWFLLAASGRLSADGGMVLLHKESPQFVITVFASPTPPRAGVVDLSVLVQASETLDPVLDADVQFEIAKGESLIQVRATRNQMQNKLLYSASVHLDDPGEWRYAVSVGTVKISGVVVVAAEQAKLAAHWSYLALPFVCIAVFALHQWLRWGREA